MSGVKCQMLYYNYTMKKSIYLILDNLRSLYNIGSIFRSADAFGVERIFLCGISAYPPQRQMRKIAKTSLGAERTVPWEYHRYAGVLIRRLKKQHTHVVALEINAGAIRALPLQKFHPKFPMALVLGNEVNGISRNILRLCHEIVTIPQFGTKESLNVAVTAGIALYAIRSK